MRRPGDLPGGPAPFLFQQLGPERKREGRAVRLPDREGHRRFPGGPGPAGQHSAGTLGQRGRCGRRVAQWAIDTRRHQHLIGQIRRYGHARGRPRHQIALRHKLIDRGQHGAAGAVQFRRHQPRRRQPRARRQPAFQDRPAELVADLLVQRLRLVRIQHDAQRRRLAGAACHNWFSLLCANWLFHMDLIAASLATATPASGQRR